MQKRGRARRKGVLKEKTTMLNKILTDEKLLTRATGLDKKQFETLFLRMRKVKEKESLNQENRRRSPGGGRKSKLSEKEQMCLVLFWYKYSLPRWILGLMVDLNESNVKRTIDAYRGLIEEAADPELKNRLENMKKGKVNIDATEQRIQRPSRKQRSYFSGKKHLHTIKSQIVSIPEEKLIADVSVSCPGKVHDYKLFKRSKVVKKIGSEVEGNLDSAYQGIKKDYPEFKGVIPFKKKKGKKLSRKENAHNKKLSSERVEVEHEIAKIKKYSVIGGTYRFKRGNYNQDLRNVVSLVNYRVLSSREVI